MVFDTQGDKILTKSLNVLKRGGQIIRISGPPDLNFAEAIHANWLLKKVIPLLSWSIRCKAKQRGIDYSFLFMQPNGAQLTQITQLDEAEKLKPIIDQIHDFDQAQEALQYVNTGRSKGKVILKIKSSKHHFSIIFKLFMYWMNNLNIKFNHTLTLFFATILT